MVKYKISFKFDLDEILDQVDSDHSIDIEELDDQCFMDLFETKKDIKEFEDWYNDGVDTEDEKIKVIDIVYDGCYETDSEIEITLENELQESELNNLKDMLMEYMFDTDYPVLRTYEYGTTYEPYWNGYRQEPDERKVSFEFNETYSISDYKNVKIVKL